MILLTMNLAFTLNAPTKIDASLIRPKHNLFGLNQEKIN